jgi:hypothetical protein
MVWGNIMVLRKEGLMVLWFGGLVVWWFGKHLHVAVPPEGGYLYSSVVSINCSISSIVS